jgi:hypothetical protein
MPFQIPQHKIKLKAHKSILVEKVERTCLSLAYLTFTISLGECWAKEYNSGASLNQNEPG